MNFIKKLFSNPSPAQMLALSFLIAISIGTALLLLPISSTRPVSFIEALFTATSATTVTGLNVVDVGQVYTRFGHWVLIVLFKVGGLGLMTFTILGFVLLRRKISLKSRLVIQEAFNQTTLGGLVRLVRYLFIFSLIIELAGTLILSMRFVPQYGWSDGLFYSLFHAVSAFNNAGFSLFTDNLIGYARDPIVNLVITALIIIGGLGFTVIYDLFHTKRFHALELHSKVMLLGTLILNVGGALLLFALEYTNADTIGGFGAFDKLQASYFQAVTARTAGFNTIDFSAIRPGTELAIMFLMFIGAGSASTGSGIKVSTFMVIVLTVLSYLKGEKEPVLFGRSISNTTVIKSFSIAVISFAIVLSILFLLTFTDGLPFHALAFEAFSAFATAGLSVGITVKLSTAGKLLICLLMYIGRIGPLTIAFALNRARPRKIQHPKGRIYAG